jgi:hypothetical protein
MKIDAARRAGHTVDPKVIKALKARAHRLRPTDAVAYSRSLKAFLDHADAIEHGKPTISPGKARLRPNQ